MSKEQIEEMAELICDNKDDRGICSTDGCICNYNCEYKYSAEALYNAGYRKQSENTVDAVRCKDCRFYDIEYKCHNGDGFGRCNHPNQEWDVECYDLWLETKPNDYCSYGEMKGGE